MALDILIVDDEADIRELIAGILSDEGYETRTANDSDNALKAIEARRPALAILDIWLQGSRLDGLELLDVVKQRHSDLPVIVISGHGNIETAVAAIKRGAFDFIEKPFRAEHLLHLVERATETERLRRENEELRKKSGYNLDLIGSSAVINTLRQAIEKVAPTGSRVMISGPSGSGKEVVAKLLHVRSPRQTGPFIAVNAVSIEPGRMESELFGIEQNGVVAKTGLFERAHGGTLFLDEIAEMPMTTQAKILRVLTNQTFERVGGSTQVQVDVRVISATSQNLLVEMEEGRFREDLYHRLNVVPIAVPPVRDRREDIPDLVAHFVTKLSRATGTAPLGISQEAMAALQAYDWPGNVRQLRNLVERLLIMADKDNDGIIELSVLPPEITDDAADLMRSEGQEQVMSVPLREARETFEREYLRVQITRFSGNISKTANFIGMERSALHRKLKSLGIRSGDKAGEKA